MAVRRAAPSLIVVSRSFVLARLGYGSPQAVIYFSTRGFLTNSLANFG